MSKNFGKCFGPSTRDLSFRLRCPSFLLSKFASQLKLIQPVVRVGMLGICVTVKFSGSCSQDSRSQCRMSHGPSSGVIGVRVPVPGSQSPCLRVPRVPSPRVSSLRVPGSGSQLLILDYALQNGIVFENAEDLS